MTISETVETQQPENGDGGTAARQRWMGLLARAPADEVVALLHALDEVPSHDRLRGPEAGLVMVRGRAGGSGAPFNLGEVTVTRCTVRLKTGSVGHGYVSGRGLDHAEAAAVLDAMLQEPAHHGRVMSSVIDVLDHAENAARDRTAAKAAATRVNFFTMARGED